MNIIDATLGYFRGSLEELHHVRWPTRNQAVRLSAIVLGFTLASAAVYGFLDFLLGQGMSLLLQAV
jgi:preprotein translocase SecE subunit